MKVDVSELEFRNKAENTGPLYFVADLDDLNSANVATMVQIPADYIAGGKGSVKVVVAIDNQGKLMVNNNDTAILPCPPYCAVNLGAKTTLSAYLN